MRKRLTTTAFVRAVAAAALAACTVLAAAGAAAARSTQPTMLQDDAQLVTGSQQQRDRRLDELKRIGVEIVKVRVNWRAIAPQGRSKPSGFDGSNPNAYPSGAWAPYDAVVRGARARGLGVMLQLGGSAPEWATPGKHDSQVRKPNAREFRKFVQAVGTRYSGSFGGSAPAPGGGGGGGGGIPIPIPGVGKAGATAAQAPGALPRVTLYSVWNEPNLRSWLAPQRSHHRPASPRIYRRLLFAAANGLQASGHGHDQLLIGELMPFARSGAGRSKTRPLAFLRELACVNRHFRPYRGRAAKRRGCRHFHKLPGTGLAYHPYTLGGGPSVRTPNRDDASISDLHRVTRTLDRLARRHRIRRRHMRVWITEFGFQSRPPDRYATPIRKIPGFMAKSEWIAFHNHRVASYAQYPLVDDRRRGGFQSGLRFHGGRAKPRVYKAFRHTFYVRRLSRSRVELFGCERAAGADRVTVQARRGHRGKWHKVARARVNREGYFDRRVHVRGAASKRFRYRYGKAHSRTVRAARH